MKINYFFILFILFFCTNLKSQDDVIVKRDGSTIKCIIVEIGEEDVKYKKSIDGPNYSIRKSNLLSIKLKNGETENYSENSNTSKTREESENNTREESENKNESTQWWEDENVKRYLEGVAKDVGEQIIRNCAIGKIDNHTTEIYWDGVIKDPITSEISLPIIAKWKPKFTDGSGKWIKGKILISKEGTKRWVYQNNSGVNFPDCAKNFKIK